MLPFLALLAPNSHQSQQVWSCKLSNLKTLEFSPFTKNKSWQVGQILDVDLMKRAAEVLIGGHDFSAFRSSNCSSPNTVKDIREISIGKSNFQNSILQIEIEANSFLQHMVRIITGTLVEAGQARIRCDDVEKALNKIYIYDLKKKQKYRYIS